MSLMSIVTREGHWMRIGSVWIGVMLLIASAVGAVGVEHRTAPQWLTLFEVDALWGEERPTGPYTTGYSYWKVTVPATVEVYQDRSFRRTYLINALVDPEFLYRDARLVLFGSDGEELAVVEPRLVSRLLSFESPPELDVSEIRRFGLEVMRD